MTIAAVKITVTLAKECPTSPMNAILMMDPVVPNTVLVEVETIIMEAIIMLTVVLTTVDMDLVEITQIIITDITKDFQARMDTMLREIIMTAIIKEISTTVEEKRVTILVVE